jgi:oligopeptide transport system permease protein
MAVTESARPVLLDHEAYPTRSLWQDALVRLLRNRGAILGIIFIAGLIVVAVLADSMASWGWIDPYAHQHRGSGLAHPLACSIDVDKDRDGVPDPIQFCFLFGADSLGRDLFSRTVYGARVSLAVAAVGSTMSLLLGTLYGVVSGYYGGRVDLIMMRVVDFLYGIPGLPLIIIMQVFFRGMREHADQVGQLGQTMVSIDASMGGLFFLFIALGLLSWIDMARLARGQVLSYKNKEFVEAALSIGASNRRIIFTHVLPNIIGPLIVVQAMDIPGYIFYEATLSFLGLGVNPPVPSWGALITEAINQGAIKSQTNLLLPPAIALSLTTLAFNFLGDGLRDALDPRMKE